MIASRDQSRPRPAVVLVADRTLSADYKVLFEAIFATMQTTQTPPALMRTLMSPTMPTDPAGRAVAAPLGLRRIESALLGQTGLTERDVVVTTPEALGELLGPWVRIVAVSSSDPLGQGMSNTTTANFYSGPLYSRLWTDQMMRRIGRAKARFGFTVVAGGAGAWQYARDPAAAARHGIDTIFEGYFEHGGAALFEQILAGRTPPVRFVQPAPAVADIAPIRRRSLLGAIELSRGCGKGCRFCHSAEWPMEHLPAGTILADLETNLAAGQRSVASTSEDFFRYGGANHRVNFEALRGLLDQVRRLPGLSLMQIDHANISSIMQLSDEQLCEVRRLLAWNRRTDYLWVNLGIESANGQLVAANSPGKIAPFRPDDWPQLVRQAADKLNRAGFFPVFSIILGLAGETPDDVARTLRLVRELAERPAVIFPVFHEPVRPSAGRRFDLSCLRADHLELFRTCYEVNFKRVPRLFWDNQRAGGVGWGKRLLVQALGRGEVVLWRSRLDRLAEDIAARGESHPVGRSED